MTSLLRDYCLESKLVVNMVKTKVVMVKTKVVVFKMGCRKSQPERWYYDGNFMIIVCMVNVNPIWAATWQNQQSDCAPSEDSDQHGHPPSLIRVFAVCLMGSLGPKLSSCGHSDQTGRMPRLIWVFAGRTLILLVLSCRGSYTTASKFLCNTIFHAGNSTTLPEKHKFRFNHINNQQ